VGAKITMSGCRLLGMCVKEPRMNVVDNDIPDCNESHFEYDHDHD
jgi:hypothetical protein